MFKNYLKIAWRNLLRNKLYSFITISGLSIGLAVCIQIVLYLGHEYSYDKFHGNIDDIYRVETKIKFGNDPIFLPYMGYTDGSESVEAIPAIEDFHRYLGESRKTVWNPEDPSLKFLEDKILFVDENFFSFFSFELLEGDAELVLQNPFSIVLTETIAKKYFGNQDPIGKTLRYDGENEFVITGIAKDAPSNSTIDFQFLASVSSFATMEGQKFHLEDNAPEFTTYFKLRESIDPTLVETALSEISSFTGNDHAVSNRSFILKPLSGLHLGGSSFNVKYIRIFPFVALLVLLLALVNYASLSTARSSTRSKEIGVRKVLGAKRKSIALQFFFESSLYSTIAFTLGYVLCMMFQPYFFNFLQIPIDNAFLYSPEMLLSCSVLFLFTIILAATYPSILLSAYRPVRVLYGKFTKQEGGLGVRKFLTVFQFTISVILIICGIVIDRQMEFFRHTETGVDRENTIMVSFSPEVGKQFNAFNESVLARPGVVNTSVASTPLYKGHNMMGIQRNDSKEMAFLPFMNVDSNFVSLLNLQWDIKPSDSIYANGQKEVALVNEETIEKLNLNDNPVGQKINGQYDIKGVLKDFVYTSMHQKIGALCLLISANDKMPVWVENGGTLFIKVHQKINLPSFLGQLRKIHEQYDSQNPLSYHFLDDAFDEQYKAEDRLAKIFSVFTAFAILIAAMGLFGLITFMSLERRKEIGIRKVLGASERSVVSLLSAELLVLVMVSVVIASPFAYWLSKKWLEDFAYRISISWWMFAGAIVGTLFIAFITLSFQAIKAARANPVKSLRTE